VISTAVSVTLVHSICSGPAPTLSPSAQDTLAPATPSDARPSWIPPNVTVVPRISASAPSPERVAVQELVVHETFSEPMEQPASGARTRPPARRPAARRAVRGVEDVT
jgi:hypothetical protein